MEPIKLGVFITKAVSHRIKNRQSEACTLNQCKMNIVYLSRLDDFGRRHANARKSLSTWKNVVVLSSWKSKMDVLKDFPKAKMIKNNRARFEIVHNLYRLIAHIHYDEQ